MTPRAMTHAINQNIDCCTRTEERCRLEFARVEKGSEASEDLRHKLEKFEIEGFDSRSKPEQPQPLMSHSSFEFESSRTYHGDRVCVFPKYGASRHARNRGCTPGRRPTIDAGRSAFEGPRRHRKD